MKIKLFVLLVLGALASGTTAWAAAEKSNAANASGACCGFCVPGEPCGGIFCD